MVFCNKGIKYDKKLIWEVTILILVDGFLQSIIKYNSPNRKYGHNPYFSRWFSAIPKQRVDTIEYIDVTILILVDGFLQ